MFLPVYLKSWESYWANQSIGFEPLVYDNGGLLFSLIPTLPRTFHVLLFVYVGVTASPELR